MNKITATTTPPIGSLPINEQLTKDGKLKHLLSIEGLNSDVLIEILDTAESFSNVSNQSVKKVPLLRGKTIFNLFFENSTRTRTTFELAAKRLSADLMTMDLQTSSTTKGESLLDTLNNLQSMYSDMFIVRHHDSGAAQFIARHVAPHISVINAGDGRHAHPTQALLDIFTIRKYKKDFTKLRVAIVGDIMHSRVARSQIHALNLLNTGEVRVVAPRTLIPVAIDNMGVDVYHDMEAGLKNVDVIIMLRLQKERMHGALIPSENEYFQCYGLDKRRLKLADKNAIVMHPGPVNRGVEISSSVADGPQSTILEQVSHGLSVRMAVMSLCLGSAGGSKP